MKQLFAVMLERGPAWQDSLPLEGQKDWDGHASFMDNLVEEGFVLLGGPLPEAHGALLIVRAESPEVIHQRMAADPWRKLGLLGINQISSWELRLGKLPEAPLPT